MLQIKRLYTEPALIDPVEFTEGLNIIMGEKDTSSSKNNGVGKSMCIEFINFALLKSKSSSRVSKIPSASFSHDTLICLDLTIHGTAYTIKRSISESERPTIFSDGGVKSFSKLDDATLFITEKLFSSAGLDKPSLREMLGPLIRDERSEFKSIVSCFDTAFKVPDNYTPHLYLLGISPAGYREIKAQIKDIDDVSREIKKIEENILLLRRKSIDDARSDLNDLDGEVKAIHSSIENLENTTGFDLIKDDIVRLENEIDGLRTRKSVLKQSLSRLKPISEKIQIDTDELAEFYNQLKSSLGDLIVKDLDQIISFKKKIENFQNQLIKEQRDELLRELKSIDENLQTLDKQYSENIKILDQQGNLKNLKQSYAVYQSKSEELGQLKGFLDRYSDLETKRQRLKSEKEIKLLELQGSISIASIAIKDFEKTILEVHEFIQGNRKASFEIKQVSKNQVVDIIMRIDDDGSHSVDREKVFIYDISLLINRLVRARHPGFLIHDNIFEVDQDTLIKNLKFIVEKTNLSMDQQYIVTLNADRLESVNMEPWYQILQTTIRATFTKQNRFLKSKYQETK